MGCAVPVVLGVFFVPAVFGWVIAADGAAKGGDCQCEAERAKNNLRFCGQMRCGYMPSLSGGYERSVKLLLHICCGIPNNTKA